MDRESKDILIKQIKKFQRQFKKNNVTFLKNKNIKNLNDIKWKKIITADTEEEKIFLEDYNKFRKVCVDTILQSILTNYECGIISAGSIDMSSDYDITVDCLGKSAQIIELFNDIFEEIWNKSSAEIFDTNIYGIGYFFNQKRYFTKILKSNIFKKQYNVYMINITDENEKKLDVKNQTTWAMLLIYKYFYELSEVNKKEFLNNFQITNLNKIEKFFTKLINNVNYHDITSLNNEYKKQLEILEKMIFKNNQQNFLKRDIKNQIAKTMFYGNETYFTQGSFFHVVGNIQGQKNIPLTRDEYYHSIIENFGYLLMELEHSENYYQFISLSSKYLSRINNALSHFESKLSVNVEEELKEIKKFRTSLNISPHQKKLTSKLIQKYEFTFDEKEEIEEDKIEFLKNVVKFINKYINFPIKVKE